ncbi:MAG: acyl-ACP thioesterase [Treponema sp.]|jgi:acyl-ACP thioesterase|nr:acyl-ACP thioesterase [Treponema sp.]
MNIWQENAELRFGVIDRSDRLTLSSAFDFFQELAISHAEALGVGRDSMEKTGQVWILSRISVQFDRRPRYGEKVVLRTWPRGSEKLFALRDYDIRDEKDIPIVRGRSGWLIVDIEKRRPLRPQAIMAAMPLNEGLDALIDGGAGLPVRAGLSKAAERTARYSDIDYNGHVNNTRYIQWIQDLMECETLERASRMRLDINFVNEIRPGEVTGLFTGPIEDSLEAPAPGEWLKALRQAEDKAENPVEQALAIEGRKTGTSSEAAQVNFRAELRLFV